MAENKSNRSSTKFDFVKPAKVEFSSGFSLEEQKKGIDLKLSETKKVSKVSTFAAIVSLVAVALIVLCGYAVWQLIETNKKIDQAVVQKKLDVDKSIIVSGDSFSLVMATNPPAKFTKTSAESKMDSLDSKKSTITSYFYELQKDENQKLAGIEVTNTEYDNKLSQDSFANKYLEFLGSEYTMSSEKTFLPRGFFTNKIIPKNNPDNIAFYPVVSSNNYYIIKTTNQIRDNSDLVEISKFVDGLINQIYLN